MAFHDQHLQVDFLLSRRYLSFCCTQGPSCPVCHRARPPCALRTTFADIDAPVRLAVGKITGHTRTSSRYFPRPATDLTTRAARPSAPCAFTPRRRQIVKEIRVDEQWGPQPSQVAERKGKGCTFTFIDIGEDDGVRASSYRSSMRTEVPDPPFWSLTADLLFELDLPQEEYEDFRSLKGREFASPAMRRRGEVGGEEKLSTCEEAMNPGFTKGGLRMPSPQRSSVVWEGVVEGLESSADEDEGEEEEEVVV